MRKRRLLTRPLEKTTTTHWSSESDTSCVRVVYSMLKYIILTMILALYNIFQMKYKYWIIIVSNPQEIAGKKKICRNKPKYLIIILEWSPVKKRAMLTYYVILSYYYYKNTIWSDLLLKLKYNTIKVLSLSMPLIKYKNVVYLQLIVVSSLPPQDTCLRKCQGRLES